MKILFAHDHIFRIDKIGNIYTKGGLPKEIWSRYILEPKTEISILARYQDVKEVTGLKSAQNENIRFTFLNDINRVKNKFLPSKKIISQIEAEVKISDLVIVRLPSEIGNLTCDIANKYNKKVIIEVVACVWDALWNYGKVKAKIYAPIAFFKMRKRIKKSQYSIYVTNKWLQSRYPTKGHLIGCSDVEIENLESSKFLENLESKGIRSEINIGLIGNIGNKIKGIDVALKAIKLLKTRGYKVKLKILGAGDKSIWTPLTSLLKLENEVHFEGILPSGEPILKWLDGLDIYIQPSYQEGLPRAVVEAMSRALPIVTSNAGGCIELINPELIHKKGNFKELANKIEELINDEKRRRKEGEENKEKAKKYLKNVLFQKRKKFLKEVIKY